MLGLLLMMLSQNTPKPVLPLPSANQMAWHQRQYYAFVHFGPNTFTGVEWGHGDEDPKVFDPKELDCRQWCRTFKEAGMSGVVLTAKHHDGFALWQSKYTTHGVMSSSWRGGKGDVLKELSEACKEYGLWLGVYLSPWDRNHPTYGSDLYNDTFVAMLKEVLTNYGDIKEVWFDGANGEGPNGKRQEYDWPRFVEAVRTYAPNAVIFHDGGDVRWVGNENGFIGETNWNFLPSGHWPGDQTIYDVLNSGDPKGDKYSPGECDVSIRPGWFWRESENSKVKDLEQLAEIWYRSVGQGGNLLLNVPPNTRGLISEEDARALMEFRRWREATFEKNIAKSARVRATGERKGSGHEADKLLDESADTYYTNTDGRSDCEIVLTWPKPIVLDHLVIREHLPLGQRVSEFEILYDLKSTIPESGGQLALNTTVGYQRIIRFRPTETDNLTIKLKSRNGPLAISSVAAYLSPPSANFDGGLTGPGTPVTEFLTSVPLTIVSGNPRATVYYTTDGTEPNERSQIFVERLNIDKSCTIKARAFYKGVWSFKVSEITFKKHKLSDLWPATVFIREPDPGLRFSYFEQGWQTLDQLESAVLTSSGVSSTGLDLGLRKRADHFALVFEGVLSVPENGIYTFSLTSDDGSRLRVDDHLVVDNDGLHGMETRSGTAPLAAGYHRVRVEYFNATGGMGLRLEWRGPGLTPGPIPASAWRR